ncbi:hypothetical protein INR49_007642 [Caranx melampygus]|nr:hypothetical protein INR49_007642 [Caranx melampygus]
MTPASSPPSPSCGRVFLRFATGKEPRRKQQHGRCPAQPHRPCKDLQSPKHRGCSRYLGFNNGDSPGDVEASQDIIWDSTSPTQANAGLGHRNTRVVEISDIVNRIAPKDVKPKGAESPLLQWIGDSAVPCTPEIRQPRARKKSSRQSSVEDLMKLAKQFDKNMQQDKETSEQLNTLNNNVNECLKTSKTQLTQMSFHGSVKDPKCPSSADQVEAELHALFDSSTQKVTGPLSQGSTASACSQEIKHKPVTSTGDEPRHSELKSVHLSGSAADPVKEKGSCGFSANNCDEFDDDWENDDLLNDSFVLAMTENPDQLQDANRNVTFQSNTKTNAAHLSSVCKTTGDTNCTNQSSNVNSKPSCSALQELCPKPKTTNRSTFKLQSNPHFQPTTAAKEVSKSSFTVIQPKSQMSDQKSLTTKTLTAPQPDKITNDQRGACASAGSVKDISDSLWGDGDDDDALLYQVCDRVERTSNSQPQQESTSVRQEKPDTAGDRQQKTTAPLPIYRTWSMDAVFVTSQMTGKCSAAEIERKKQEALARRRLRMQNTPKP